MCTTCGCGLDSGTHPDCFEPSSSDQHSHRHAADHEDQAGDQDSGHLSFAGTGDREPPDGTCGHGQQQRHHATARERNRRQVLVEQDILARNNRIADANRARFAANGILAINLLSSPGSGKTTLLCQTIKALAGKLPIAVIEGDQHTDRDATRIREGGAPAYQINTGRACHLDAAMVAHALDHLAPKRGSLLFIENVGNLVCPAEFDLGEAIKVAIVSVTEGEDKPIKYAPMFAAADVLVINKIDLLPYVEFDVSRCLSYARQVKPHVRSFELSATRGDGLDSWINWLERGTVMASQGDRR